MSSLLNILHILHSLNIVEINHRKTIENRFSSWTKEDLISFLRPDSIYKRVYAYI